MFNSNRLQHMWLVVTVLHSEDLDFQVLPSQLGEACVLGPFMYHIFTHHFVLNHGGPLSPGLLPLIFSINPGSL